MSRAAGPALLLAAGAALALGGCTTGLRLGAPKPAPVVVEQPPEPPPPPLAEVRPPPPPPQVQRSCVPRGIGGPPRYPDTDAALRAAGGAADRYQLMAAGRLMRQRRLEELERVVAGCR